MAIDQIDDSLLNELRIGSVPTGVDEVQSMPLQQMPAPGQLPQPAASGPTTGHFAPGVDPSQLQAPKQRPTFMSAFLANLGPSLAHGIAAGASQPTLGGGIVAGFGGGVAGQIEQQRYQQQTQFQAEELKAKTEFQKAQAESLTPSIPMQDANGNTVMMPPAHVGQAFSAGYRFAATTQAAGTRAGAAKDVANIGAGAKLGVAEIGADTKKTLAAQSLREKVREYNSTDSYRYFKTKLDDETKLKVAELTQNKAPGIMLQAAGYASGGQQEISRAKAIMDDMENRGVLGQTILDNKTEDFLFSNGLANPSWDGPTRYQMGQLRQALSLSSSALLRAHTGRTSQDIYRDYKQANNIGQDWSALRGSLDESNGLLQHYVDMASTASITKLRQGGGGASNQTANKPKVDVDALIQSVLGKKKNATKPAGQ